MLNQEEKAALFEKYPLKEKPTHKGVKVGYYYRGKKIVSGLTHTGLVYLWGRDIKETIPSYIVDSRGWINCKESKREEIIYLLEKVINQQDKLAKEL
ncbi:hypothetical protein CHI12_09470 [Terribacillus saccharophilus]|uniref:Uncharacterized protein n=1 Tax=Terribacillus saccharophilus TaxID=361277 RepID=A0A268HD27_9BACI|nr:hypothetical protein [Terribacillus saccharophilus]PAE07786.1 hypothetical protein CHI12_09470 [Terribacillus saccharophilus]